MKVPSNGYMANSGEGEGKAIHSELWHACAGPLVSVPPDGSLVVYFPQGHSEQVAATMQKETNGIPSYPNLPSKLICMLHNVTLHVDPETDEVYAQMALQPINKIDRDALLASEIGLKQCRQPAEFFCKTLTASDTSTHGGFFVPRRAAEKIFPPLDFSMQPPAQELVAKDLHGQTWKFRHIYRGQPKRHLLTTGWSVFVSSKRLFAGDSVLFVRDETSQLLLGVRRANRQQPAVASSVISSDSMHIGILAAAAHASANNSPFTVFYNPRASPSEFVIPLAKYNKAMYTQVSLGMRFRMIFETDESGVRRYMGTITSINDLDPVRWKNSQWRNLQVGWDESTAGERLTRVSIWEIEPVVAPFYICPPPFFRPRFPRQPGFSDDDSEIENIYKRDVPWIGDEFGMRDAASASSMFPGLSLVQWMSMQQNNQFSGARSAIFPSTVSPSALRSNLSVDDPSKLFNVQTPSLSMPNLHFNKENQENQLDQLQQPPQVWSKQQQQQQLQQLWQNPVSSQQQTLPLQLPQQQQLQQLWQNPVSSQQQTLPLQLPQQQQHQVEQQPLLQQPHQQQQEPKPQMPTSMFVNSSHVSSNHSLNQNPQQSSVYCPLQQQQQSLVGNNLPQQNLASINKNSIQLPSLPPDVQFQQQMEQQTSVLQRHQQQLQTRLQQPSQPFFPENLSQRSNILQSLSEHQLQLQLLQKLQQQQQSQQQQSPLNPPLQPQVTPQQQASQQNQLPQQHPLSQYQQQVGVSSILTPSLMHPSQIPANQLQGVQKSLTTITVLSDGDAPSCSTSPSTNNGLFPPSSLLNRTQLVPNIDAEDSVVQPGSNVVHGFQSRLKHEIPTSKGVDSQKFKGTINDPLETSSSAMSYCLDTNGLQQNFTLPNFGLEVDVQSHSKNNFHLATSMDGLTPDTLLSRGFDSGKDLHNLLSKFNGAPREDTELSVSEVSPQSFRVPSMPLKSVCSNDIAINEPGVLCGGTWASQTPRMRTYTKVQKRGSVGRSIDVTRYKGYDELRYDLAKMFGIEGKLEDPHRTDWKLVYVDHENDILLVGDDPWEEFVSCVQSIKILSSAEVQSLDGDLGNASILNQACSGTDSGNAWRGHYDDSSAASFNR